MSILFASNYVGAFKLISGYPTSSTNATYTDLTYSDESLTGFFVLQTPDFPVELTEGWIHMSVGMNQGIPSRIDGEIFGLYNTVRGGFDVVLTVVDDLVQFQYWNGSALTTVGTSTSLGANGRFNYDLYFIKHASAGVISLYKDGVLVLTVTGLNTSNFAVNAARFMGVTNTLTTQYLSQFIVSDESTIGCKVFSADLSAGATNTFVTGGATDVSVDALKKLNSFMAADTNNQLATFAAEAIPAGTLVASAVCVNLRSKRGATGPANIQIAARVGGTDYFTSDLPLTIGIDPQNYVYDTNPATGLAWTNAAVDAAEFGARART